MSAQDRQSDKSPSSVPEQETLAAAEASGPATEATSGSVDSSTGNETDFLDGDPRGEESIDEGPHLDDDDLSELLGSALGGRQVPAPDVLGGVQEKIRQRSKGKFFADGWSTQRGPRSTYVVTSLLMLVLVIAMYLALTPGGIGSP